MLPVNVVSEDGQRLMGEKQKIFIFVVVGSGKMQCI